MKNCIYDLICFEDADFKKHRLSIEKKFCRPANYECSKCRLFMETENLEDLKVPLKR